ncbi:MAG: acyltransferase family protein [Clostridia bacterium]|nr:acyltransferase family protein [Clostridia bacterium]
MSTNVLERENEKVQVPLKKEGTEKKSGRIDWVDALKFIGIFFIYVAHFVENSGKLCLYAYAFHVPLFFFIAGFFALKHKEDSFWKYGWHKVKTLLLPYFFFGFLTIAVLTLQANYLPISFKEVFSDLLLGMRNRMFASPLWFFPCLFLVEVFFEGMLKIFRNKYFVLTACVILFLAAEQFFYQDYVVLPRLWFSADTALYYLLYYAIGAVSFEKISKASFSKEKPWKKVLFSGLFLATALIACMVFFEKEAVLKNIFLAFPLGDALYEVFVALSLILFHIVIAKQLTKFPLVCEIGRNTLWLCGNELVMKTVLPVLLSVFGLHLSLQTPLHTVLYSFILLVIAVKTVIPVERKLIGNLFDSRIKHK